jgi:Ca2+-binding EF-hand superfamily protein
VQAAFELFDVDQNGSISRAEMRIYLTSVFKVLYEMQPHLRTQVGVGPEVLGAVTTDQAFAEADLDNDGSIRYK